MYKNGKNAKIDGLIQHSNPAILRCFHYKHTLYNKPFVFANIISDTKADMANVVTPRLNSDVWPLHIYVTNRNMTGDREIIRTSDVVVISRSELIGFFSRTFGERIALMVSSGRSED